MAIRPAWGRSSCPPPAYIPFPVRIWAVWAVSSLTKHQPYLHMPPNKEMKYCNFFPSIISLFLLSLLETLYEKVLITLLCSISLLGGCSGMIGAQISGILDSSSFSIVVQLIGRPTTTEHHNKPFVNQGFLLAQDWCDLGA